MAHQTPDRSGGGSTSKPAGSAPASPEVPLDARRSFLRKSLAVVIGGFISLFPAAAGLAVFLDPIRSRKPTGGNADGFLKVAQLEALQVGVPRRVPVISDRVDAWNYFPNEPIGAVYVLRKEDGNVTAHNVVCPHAGCSVDFSADRGLYQCPCHKSSFRLDGEIDNQDSPAPRGLDSLAVDAEKLKAGEVWIKFQNFHTGVAEKIAET
ncbi:MAG: ubiquinol-cytochrome c reductase iron-sulfur subunit [Planctomycetaceae bacterium]